MNDSKTFFCAHCGARLEAPAGATVRCPSCGNQTQEPSRWAPRAAEPAPRATEPTAPGGAEPVPPPEPSSWGGPTPGPAARPSGPVEGPTDWRPPVLPTGPAAGPGAGPSGGSTAGLGRTPGPAGALPPWSGPGAPARPGAPSSWSGPGTPETGAAPSSWSGPGAPETGGAPSPWEGPGAGAGPHPSAYEPAPMAPVPYQAPPGNGWAIASLVLGILGIAACMGPVTGLPAIVCAVIAIRAKQPAGLAVAGLITGLVATLGGLLLLAAVALPFLAEYGAW